jgi:hypothetical protein
MKTAFFVPLIPLCFRFLCFETTNTECKKWAGVYKTYSIYCQRQYSDSVCLDIKGNSINIGSLNKIIINSNGQKKIFNPGEIFGYFDGENTFRYFETSGAMSPSGFFLIKDTSGLIIYSQKQRSYKHSTTGYYYSKNLNDTIKILNVKNLVADFGNDPFVALVETLKNKNEEKARASIREINLIYQKYNR